MKWVLIGFFIFGVILLGGASWIYFVNADNSDAKSLATLTFIPGLAVLAIDVIAAILWWIF